MALNGCLARLCTLMVIVRPAEIQLRMSARPSPNINRSPSEGTCTLESVILCHVVLQKKSEAVHCHGQFLLLLTLPSNSAGCAHAACQISMPHAALPRTPAPRYQYCIAKKSIVRIRLVARRHIRTIKIKQKILNMQRIINNYYHFLKFLI